MSVENPSREREIVKLKLFKQRRGERARCCSNRGFFSSQSSSSSSNSSTHRREYKMRNWKYHTKRPYRGGVYTNEMKIETSREFCIGFVVEEQQKKIIDERMNVLIGNLLAFFKVSKYTNPTWESEKVSNRFQFEMIHFHRFRVAQQRAKFTDKNSSMRHRLLTHFLNASKNLHQKRLALIHNWIKLKIVATQFSQVRQESS